MMSKICVIILLSFVFFRCSIENEEIIDYPNATVNMQAVNPDLKAFNVNGRQYDLFYNSSGQIDSIVVTDKSWIHYVYKVAYIDKEMFEVSLWDNGAIVATNNEFVFDKKGNIVSYVYTFYLPDMQEGIATTINVGYDQRGRIASLGGTLTYDQHNNIFDWIQGSYTYRYRYDKAKNPLYPIDNLFVILVEEPVYWDYILSKHNSVSKSGSDGLVTEFINEYDSGKRLISKTAYQKGVLQEKIVFDY